jgi:hypothetical protein
VGKDRKGGRKVENQRQRDGAASRTRERLEAILEALSTKLEEKIKKGEVNLAIADLLKILQYEGTLREQEIPEEVKVIWMETENSK